MSEGVETSEKPVILVTYNMSFASDKGMIVDQKDPLLNYPSEMSFLKKMDKQTNADNRQYWINAAKLLKDFFESKKSTHSFVIGLQEMNDTHKETITATESATGTGTGTGTETETATETGTATGTATGTKYIEQQIVNSNSNYTFVVDHLYVTNTQQPALMTIWDSKQFGDLSLNQIFELAQQIDEPSKYNPKNTVPSTNYKSQFALNIPLSPKINQPGRPIMFTYTDKGYLFINIQATNNAEDSADGYKIQLGFIQNKFMLFLNKLITNGIITIYDRINPSKIFVVGDFNDRYGGLGKELLLSPGHTQYKLKFDGEAPKSCCHNLDSSCKIEKYNVSKFNNKEAKDCDFDKKFKPSGPRTDNQIATMADDGYVENYRYVGDYCFSFNGGELKMYPERETGKESIESDHEMVYMEVNRSQSLSGTPEGDDVTTTTPTTTPIESNGGRSRSSRVLKRNTKKGLPKKRRVSLKKRGARRTHKKH